MHPFRISFLIDKFIEIIVNTNYIQVDKESEKSKKKKKKNSNVCSDFERWIRLKSM